jgi:hypothetical protein
MFNALPNRQDRKPPKDMSGFIKGSFVYAVGDDDVLYARYYGVSTVWEKTHGGQDRLDQMIADSVDDLLAEYTLVSMGDAHDLKALYERR